MTNIIRPNRLGDQNYWDPIYCIGEGLTGACLPNGWNANGTTVAGSTGVLGSNASLLEYPNDVAIDSNDSLYIADTNNQRIQQWSHGSLTGVTVAGSGTIGSTSNDFSFPRALFVDTTNNSNNLYVADFYNYRIQKWRNGMSSGFTVAGAGGNASNQFTLPMGIYVDSSAAIYVADTENHRIQKWTQRSSSGTTVAGGNGMGSSLNQLSFPRNVICDTDGTLYIPDTNNHRIMKWTIGASNGSIIAGISGTSGTSETMLNYPNGITFDSDRNLYVADSSNHRVQKFLSCTGT
ncbi:unnamed protein product [Didymodactylos carnosus]|uniref:NHL repeat containing protein n=1 Tax=Didymodactylos carnosus TaxID=1234261 RepID=A0A814VLY5_9BILA|nr:unnamed protein product [Didymodactylos carnosus]CAF3953719.1 unnamed protein product [Didymodactylos carnosus]